MVSFNHGRKNKNRKDIIMTIGEKLAHYRKAKDYTQDYVAEVLGVTPQAVSKWECDISCPDILLLPKLADLYETTTDELLSRESAPITAVIPEEKRKSADEMILRIRVNVNLPLALIKIFVSSGKTPMINIGGRNHGMISNMDWNMLIQLAESGVIGRLVEVEGSDGETVIVEVV